MLYLVPDPGIPVGGTKGASVHVSEICHAMTRAGASVVLVAMKATGAPPEGVKLHLVGPGPLPKGAGGELLRARALSELAEAVPSLVGGFAPDLVCERLSLFFGGGAAIARKLSARRIVEVNAPVVDERAAHFGLAHRSLALDLETQALSSADVVSVSEPLAAWAKTRGAASAAVITNGVDTARFMAGASPYLRAATRQRLGLPVAGARVVGPQVVGFVGSLKPWHGVEVLIDAVSLMTEPVPVLLVVGDGPMRSTLEARATAAGIDDRCHFVGTVPPAQVPSYLAAMDVVAAPYLDQPAFYFSPLKVAEAMAAGKPVVASDLGPIATMTAGAAVLVPPGDAAALAAGIAGVLLDHARATMLGQAARRHAVSELSWERAAAQLLAMAPVTVRA
ncbi:MAG: glycosyltransferase family 4 protein [Acidimicrobiales bacterium]